jgi:hypothetical protein
MHSAEMRGTVNVSKVLFFIERFNLCVIVGFVSELVDHNDTRQTNIKI